MEPDDHLDLAKPENVSNEQLNVTVTLLAATVDKLSSNVDRMIDDAEKSREVMQENTRVTRRTKKENRLLRGALAVSVALVAVAVLLGWRIQAQNTCFANWANASTNRSGTLTELASTRSEKLAATVKAEHAALAYALAHPNGDAAEAAHEVGLLLAWNTATTQFTAADDAYTAAVKANPIPDSPKYSCAIF